MKPMKLTSLMVMLLVGFSAAAQEEFFDDVYFSSSKKDKKEKSYWSIKRMAEQCNMSYESVRRAIKSLEDQCLIDVEHCSVNGKKIQIFILCIG